MCIVEEWVTKTTSIIHLNEHEGKKSLAKLQKRNKRNIHIIFEDEIQQLQPTPSTLSISSTQAMRSATTIIDTAATTTIITTKNYDYVVLLLLLLLSTTPSKSKNSLNYLCKVLWKKKKIKIKIKNQKVSCGSEKQQDKQQKQERERERKKEGEGEKKRYIENEIFCCSFFLYFLLKSSKTIEFINCV